MPRSCSRTNTFYGEMSLLTEYKMSQNLLRESESERQASGFHYDFFIRVVSGNTAKQGMHKIGPFCRNRNHMVHKLKSCSKVGQNPDAPAIGKVFGQFTTVLIKVLGKGLLRNSMPHDRTGGINTGSDGGVNALSLERPHESCRIPDRHITVAE
mgnify:CR=1 FL=1